MGKAVGVRFREGGKIYNFDTGDLTVKRGDLVIVKTEQGPGLGCVTAEPRPLDVQSLESLKKLVRLANEDDLWQHEKNVARERYAYEFCQERIKARELDMKLVTTEVLFDGSKIVFYYTADGRIDFRMLVKDLVAKFRTRIEMRQIGVRHEAKMVGGLGCCGRELCCSLFLNEFAPISVKMAKEQNLSLNPTKISGVCGRLMCCLTYEYKTYMDLKRGLPKLGKKIMTDSGEGKVVRQNIVHRISTVQLADGKEIDIEHPLPEPYRPIPDNEVPDEVETDAETEDESMEEFPFEEEFEEN